MFGFGARRRHYFLYLRASGVLLYPFYLPKFDSQILQSPPAFLLCRKLCSRIPHEFIWGEEGEVL